MGSRLDSAGSPGLGRPNIDAIKEIVREAKEQPEKLHHEPHSLPVGRLDEVATARRINAYLQGQSEDPILRWKPAPKEAC